MSAEGFLIAAAELALGLAGFSGIGVVFTREPGALDALEKYRLAILFGSSFGAMFLALLPLWAHLATGMEETSWRLACGTMAALTLGMVAGFVGPTRRYLAEVPGLFNPWILGALTVGYLVNGAAQIGAAAGVDALPPGPTYGAGLLWMLAHSSLQFARILFVRPGDLAAGAKGEGD